MQCPLCPIDKAFCVQAARLSAHIAKWHNDKTLIRLPSLQEHQLLRRDSDGPVSVSASKSARKSDSIISTYVSIKFYVCSRFRCALCVPLLTSCCFCSRSVVLWISAQDADAPAAMPECAAEASRQTAAGESDEIMRAREASLFCFLFNSRSCPSYVLLYAFVSACTVCRHFCQLKARISARFAPHRWHFIQLQR